jgi:hypothetical protein
MMNHVKSATTAKEWVDGKEGSPPSNNHPNYGYISPQDE